MPHYAIAVNLNLCTGCMSCEVACKQENDVPLGVYWNCVQRFMQGDAYPDFKQFWLPTMCQQCQEAPCVEVCPVGASYRDGDDNTVLIDEDKCIGCHACISACPYGVRTYVEDTNKVVKCELCHQLTTQGDKPACVKNCPAGCRFYGDADDPDSDFSKAIANADADSVHQFPDSGNKPTSAYILSDRIGDWPYEG